MVDINGTWLGTYWQDEIPTRFEAVIIQSNSNLTGNILDDGFLGDAQLSGKILGLRISFTKIYLLTSPDPIKYTGLISEDETYMRGKWNIGRNLSGSWEAQRSGESLIINLETSFRKRISQTIGN
ncbi:hypothetical protein [Calothrix sp. 336/3]|uniref:hypothetical protein n=1 Tax=Calothrix sp. 336/3 TaxID=1337936 RepID=UPI0004E3B4D2|nr:hypothetical protein [Calothrix sp. 336/3]AKG24059.1 hypothetical protein IJ00_24550 [Calothrix sp. 336/3]